MEYIVSRRFAFPVSASELSRDWYFNLWKTRQWPYERLQVSDVFYWYESPRQQIVWKAAVERAERFQFTSASDARRQLIDILGDFDEDQPYFVNAPATGFGLAYRTRALARLSLPKPDQLRIPQLGWQPVTNIIRTAWLKDA